jgi:hypothetical protein
MLLIFLFFAYLLFSSLVQILSQVKLLISGLLVTFGSLLPPLPPVLTWESSTSEISSPVIPLPEVRALIKVCPGPPNPLLALPPPWNGLGGP